MSVINTNTISLNAQRNLSTNSASLSTTIQRLSSGQRINSAKDDAAGLAISERFSTQIRGMNQAARNANDGISLAQTAEGSLGEIGNNLQRIRELAVQSRNATNSDTDRAALNAEVTQLKSEIQRVAEQTNFNGTKLLDGSFTNQAFQIGANQGQTINISGIANANTSQLGSWTAVEDRASTQGVAPTGTTTGGTTTAGAGTLNTANFGAPADTNGDGTQYDFAGFDLTVGTTTVTVGASGGATAAAAREALLSNIATAINGNAALDDLTVDGTTGAITNDGAAVTIAGADAAAQNIFGSAPVAVTGATTTGTTSFGAIAAGDLTINGQDIVVGAASSSEQRLSDLVTAINASSAGVTASIEDGAISLTARGNEAINIEGEAAAAASAGLTIASTAGGATTNGFAGLDISTAEGADNAILAMDAALESVNSSRADLGAIQNRFSSVVANLQTGSENLSASRSRIMDTDFAKETAELSRTQVLQQAGTAMLAQANQLPNNVLSLLR